MSFWIGQAFRTIIAVPPLTFLAVAVHASAFEPRVGCDRPGPQGSGHQFFVDPAIGSKDNDGSRERPWRTLAEVLDPANHLIATESYGRTPQGLGPPSSINPNGPIKPGDTIVLMSGDHGSIEARQYVNREFISVVAAEGQVPVVRALRLTSVSHWFFRGVKFQGVRPENDKNGPLVGVLNHAWTGPSDNVSFVDDSFSTEDSAANWMPEDWVNRPYATGLRISARCTTLAHDHFFNLRDGIDISGPESIIEDNLIEDMGNDGIDMTTSDLVIRRNRIQSSRHTPAEPLHADGIQGWTAPGATNRDVVIDSNSIVNLNRDDDNYMQGISIFDGKWDGLTVTNNLVITNAWHGIALWGVANAIVANNTVVPARPDRWQTWLMIHDSKDKSPSRDVTVRNNIATQILVAGESLTVDHNIAEKKISIQTSGRQLEATSGMIGDKNIIDPSIFKTFADFDPAHGKLDLRPGPRSTAAGSGSEAAAPQSDIEQRPRKNPFDIGAFAR